MQGERLALALWRARAFALVRIVFGGIWAVDAWFKWQPDFANNFTSYLVDAQQQQGQPSWVQSWIGFWIHTVNVNPHFFASVVAFSETVIAAGLILGAFTNAVCVIGGLMCVVIWATAESFGGPYQAGSTDIGAAIIYVLVFACIFLVGAGRYSGVDSWLRPRLGALRWLCA